jgi:hypothetical protein
MEEERWLHDLAALPPGREVPLQEGSVGLQRKCGHNGEYQSLA